MSTSWSTASQVTFTTRRKLSSIIQSPSLSPSASPSPSPSPSDSAFLPLLSSLFQANRRMLRAICTGRFVLSSGELPLAGSVERWGGLGISHHGHRGLARHRRGHKGAPPKSHARCCKEQCGVSRKRVTSEVANSSAWAPLGPAQGIRRKNANPRQRRPCTSPRNLQTTAVGHARPHV